MKPKPELMGVAEIATSCKVSRQQAWNWLSKPSFPKPIVRLKMGPIYDGAQIRAWHVAYREAIRLTRGGK
jgi:predicted DNA-binding transcriptional regulator AlpA